MLRLVEASIKVAHYVDKVDGVLKEARRRQLQLQGVTGVFIGLITALDTERGMRLAEDRDFQRDAKHLRRFFEIARRYKILNPERMRTEYGQLVYLLQDAAISDIQETLGFDVNAPVKTVFSFLKERNGLSLLEDPLVVDATKEVLPDPNKSRAQIQQLIKRKERAVKTLGRNYAKDRLSSDDIELCLCSICDNESYLNSARLPIDQTLDLLRTFFDPKKQVANEDMDEDDAGDLLFKSSLSSSSPPKKMSPSSKDNKGDFHDLFQEKMNHFSDSDVLLGSARSRSDRGDDDLFQQQRSNDDIDFSQSPHQEAPIIIKKAESWVKKKNGTPHQKKKNLFSLAISDADGSGARLSHSHARQFRFAEQSLALWRAIVDDMFRLWFLAEGDLLSGDAPYALRDTGQGFQRVQACPRTYAAMVSILNEERDIARKHDKGWVGSSMVHMGDHNVPNALTFLDKYAQVARILRPLIAVLNRIKVLVDEDAHIKKLVHRAFGSVPNLEQAVLADFFRHAFDGSGADNFYDAGSCVDGRLTSAWNWCNQLPTKPYFLLFKLCGFNGFDGEFA